MATAQSRAISHEDTPKNKERNEASSETIVLRAFGGVNVQSPREDIGDNEFAWLEELIPIAAGNLALIKGPSAALVTLPETGPPTYVLDYNAGGIDYGLAVWANSGNAWVGTPTAGATWTKIASGLFTSGGTSAAQWSNLGILIVDPAVGYYDYNVTAPNTLTNLSGQLYGPAVATTNPGQLTGGTVPALRITDPNGTGATIGASASLVSASIAAMGSGYSIGDVLTAVGGTLTTATQAPAAQQNQPLVFTVTTVSSGTVTGVSATSNGYYQAAPANPIAFTGGTGTGFKSTATWSVDNPYIITPGQGYTAPVVQAYIGGVWVAYSMTILTGGTLLGSTIAVYAGRAWIGVNRTVQVTDAGSYSTFANSGTSFTINDSYLHDNITSLYAANNYLYIAGDDSFDILSNVTVVGGILQFSRINVSASIGTSQPLSVFPFLRALAFINGTGFYVMSGATPEKVSDKLDNFVAAINFGAKVFGMQIAVNNILCAAFLVTFADTFTTKTPVNRNILAVLFRGKWWFTSQMVDGGQVGAVFSLPVDGLLTAFGWVGPSLYQLMSATNANNWLLKTKLWDAEAPILDKQGILAGIGVVLGGAETPSFSLYVDTEKSSVLTVLGTTTTPVTWFNNQGAVVGWTNSFGATVQWVQTTSGYDFLYTAANNGGGKYMGLTATGNANVSQIRLLALELEKRRSW
jgi:hypothetical protein